MATFSAQIEMACLGLALKALGKQVLCQTLSFDKRLENVFSIHSSASSFS